MYRVAVEYLTYSETVYIARRLDENGLVTSDVKLAFHDADTDTDFLARILARMSTRMSVSVSVSASWNASFMRSV